MDVGLFSGSVAYSSDRYIDVNLLSRSDMKLLCKGLRIGSNIGTPFVGAEARSPRRRQDCAMVVVRVCKTTSFHFKESLFCNRM